MSKVRHLLINGLGCGVFAVEMIPPYHEICDDQNDHDLTKKFLSRIEESGIGPIKETVLDPDHQERAFLVLEHGCPPHKLEIEQLAEYSDRIKYVVNLCPDSILAVRMKMIEEASSK